MDYVKFIDELNSHTISEVKFKVVGYRHYENCRISVQQDILPSKKAAYLIHFYLTKDLTEHISFYNEFNESYKIFYMGRKGTFTLKQLWSKIQIIELIKFNS